MLSQIRPERPECLRMSKSGKPRGRRPTNKLSEGASKENPPSPASVEGVILLAEDEEEDVVLLKLGFAKARFLNPVQVVPDGAEAIAYLQGAGKYSNRSDFPLPNLLLLDLKMPRKNGFEVLEWLRQQPQLSALPVVVLTSSDDMRDVNRAYQLGANTFLVKPVDFAHF